MHTPTCASRAALFGAAFLAFGSLSARAATDYNTDGLDDVWQDVYDAWTLAPGDDEDSDGATNLTESIAGTNPRNPADVIKVGNMTVAGNNVVLNVKSENGKKYQLKSSTVPTGGTWTDEGNAVTGTGGNLQFVTPMGVATNRKFYRVETLDQDSDNDGVSDWAESKMGTNPVLASSPANASGGAANDGDTLRSLMSLTAAPVAGQEAAFEVQDQSATTPAPAPAKVALVRTFGTMPLAVTVTGRNGAPGITKANASPGDYAISGISGGKITIPAGAAVPGSPYEVAVNPTPDSASEVPEYVSLGFGLPSGGPEPTRATVTIRDAKPELPANQKLFVAYLGREAGVTTTASGVATALVAGDNSSALISLTFSNLSSEQNTAYLRIASDLELLNVGVGQVSGRAWQILAGQTKLTDQAMLDALENGELYIDITTATNPTGEIMGYFNRATGSTEFDPENPSLDAPDLGSANWQNPTGEALEREIWRFLSQSTFGGTQALYDEVQAEVQAATGAGGTYIDGLRNWLNKQIDPGQTPSVNFMQLVMAADNEEFMLRGNKPTTYSS
ncbi:MAG TPA: CHRD domain-containing protein, partial [Prosthecobacter sp.]|nr:CHRD domain-containing protein [Prosthecobacter sp.]